MWVYHIPAAAMVLDQTAEPWVGVLESHAGCRGQISIQSRRAARPSEAQRRGRIELTGEGGVFVSS